MLYDIKYTVGTILMRVVNSHLRGLGTMYRCEDDPYVCNCCVYSN